MASPIKNTHFPAFDTTPTTTRNADPFKDLVRRLTETYGPSGHEERIRDLIRGEIKAHADSIRADALGNLIAFRKGAGNGPRQKVMIAAHMDEIGVIVTHVDEKGYLRFTRIGGVMPLTLYGQRCLFASGLVGVFGREEKDAKRNEADQSKMFIDVGAKDGKSSPVNVGDAAGFWREFVDLGDRLVAKSMDDRIGCAVLIETMRQLKKSPHDLYFVFTTQEEIGTRGAVTSAYGIQPDLALAVDITGTGDTPEGMVMAVELGKGPAIKVKDAGMVVHPAVKNLMIETAKDLKIPYQLEVLDLGSTDARAMQVTREGVMTGCLSIPTRYVHTPSEMIDWSDVTNSVKLLVAILSKPLKLE
jgi:endoglucanase